MYQVKSRVFTDLTKNQKSDFLSFIKIYTRDYLSCDEESVFCNIVDEIEYFQKLDGGRYGYIDLSNERHLEDIKSYISAVKRYYEYKASQKPYYDEQKRIAKEIRAKINDEKQKKLPPTKKQISYYKSLCRRNNSAPAPIETMSKYDIKMEISRLVELTDVPVADDSI